RLVDDLLDVSRIARGIIDLRREIVSLEDVTSIAIEASRPTIDAFRHELVVHLPPDPVWLEVDLTRMAQVLTNLLTNAAKFTPEGGRIELRAELARRSSTSASVGAASQTLPEVVVRVIDSGIGIRADDIPRVFDMFAQADRAIDRVRGGLGI